MIRGYSCPLAVAVRENPRVCLAVEKLLGEVLGVEVQERCDRSSEAVRCCFAIRAGESPSARSNTPPAESGGNPA